MGEDFRKTVEKIDLRNRLDCPARVGAAIIIALIAVVGVFAYINSIQDERIDWGDGSGKIVEEVGVTQQSAAAEANGEESAGTPDPAQISVHVSGAVANPGVVDLQEGARVNDAIAAAGGFEENALPEAVNLARKVQDGEHVHIPTKDDAVDLQGVVESAGSYEAQGVSGSGLVNINTADAAALETLPGVGPAIAERIVSDRETHGPYGSVDDLLRVQGIGEKKLEALRSSVCV